MITPARIVLIGAMTALASASVLWAGSPWQGSGLDRTLQAAYAEVSAPATDAPEQEFTFAPFGKVSLYRSQGRPRAVVLFLSGDGGWNGNVVGMAKAMVSQGALVAGVSTPAFLKALEHNRSKCINPNYGLVALAQAVQNRAGLDDYQRPIVAGYSSGATVAFAALAQSPKGIYDGALSLSFGPDLPGIKPWCAATGFTATRMAGRPDKRWIFGTRALPAPWLVLQGLEDRIVSPTVARRFVQQVPQATLIELPKVGLGFSVQANWLPQFETAFARLLGNRTGSATDPVSGLPLEIVTDPNAPKTDTMAVFYSGDGGWAGLDREVASALAARGIPVVGVDSLRYYWNAKTPERSARDLGTILARYGREWNRPKAILVGYSFGADALPFAVRSLPSDARERVARIALMGLDDRADLQFHLSSWLDFSGGASRPTVPAVNALKGLPIECLHGSDETDSACRKLERGVASTVVLPGGHHFGGNYRLLADIIARGVA